MILDCLHVFSEGDQLHSAFEVFEKKRRLHRALSDEEVSENLKVAVVHKKLQDAELRKHLLKSAATLDGFTSIKDELINYSQYRWSSAPQSRQP